MKILLVDNDVGSRTHLAEFLRKLGHTVIDKANSKQALDIVARENFNLVLTDNNISKGSGLELLRKIHARPDGKDVDIVFLSGYSDANTVIEALRLGAFDYLFKPLSIEELIKTIGRVAKHQALLQSVAGFDTTGDALEHKIYGHDVYPLSENQPPLNLNRICICSSVIKNLFELADKLHTDRSIPILIEGETGTGKELIASYIHYGRSHSSLPFIALNCAALTTSIFESELFGYEPGTFSGGLPGGKKGKLDIAQGGTLFLDEISEMPVSLQAKLLRVLQEREFYRVGGLNLEKTDVRIICSTNKNMDKMVKEGTFRQDLYYRLNVAHIFIPPLRKRPEDILPLAENFLRQFSREKGKSFHTINPQAVSMLQAYCWPGNVRELRNIIEWIVLMNDDIELKPVHLQYLRETKTGIVQPEDNSAADTNQDFILPNTCLPLSKFSNDIVLKALEMHNGNKTETAKYLGISRSSLYYRLKHM